jgi:hypothetical protein
MEENLTGMPQMVFVVATEKVVAVLLVRPVGQWKLEVNAISLRRKFFLLNSWSIY